MTWRVIRHPLVSSDIYAMARHIAEHSGSEEAAERRVIEAEKTIATIAANPLSGTWLDGNLAGFMRRQSARDGRITVVFRSDRTLGLIYIHIVAFGGRDWQGDAERRR